MRGAWTGVDHPIKDRSQRIEEMDRAQSGILVTVLDGAVFYHVFGEQSIAEAIGSLEYAKILLVRSDND